MLSSYPKAYNLGHRAIQDLFKGPVVVQEKVDGSQFSFGVKDGVLFCRSRGAMIDPGSADKLFAGAVATAQRAHEHGVLVGGAVYRGEAMMGPRHNTLTYERAPLGHLVLFDVDLPERIECRDEDRGNLEYAAARIGCEVVPEFFRGEISDIDALKELIARPSFLGGQMEGIVIKNYNRFGVDGKMLMGKLVNDAFREQHAGNPDWKPTSKDDILSQIQERYAHPRRWEKAIERRRDAGLLRYAPQDIGPLLASIQRDVEEECADEIAQQLFQYYRKKILKGTTAGFAQWYQNWLAERQFERPENRPNTEEVA